MDQIFLGYINSEGNTGNVFKGADGNTYLDRVSGWIPGLKPGDPYTFDATELGNRLGTGTPYQPEPYAPANLDAQLSGAAEATRQHQASRNFGDTIAENLNPITGAGLVLGGGLLASSTK